MRSTSVVRLGTEGFGPPQKNTLENVDREEKEEELQNCDKLPYCITFTF